MSIKSVLTTLITTNWGDITSPRRVPLKDREVATALIDNIYPTPVNESGDVGDAGYTIPSSPSNYLYNMQFTKIGRRVFIEGWIQNASGVNVSNPEIFTFPATVDGNPNEYQPDPAFSFRGEAVQLAMHTRAHILISGGKLSVYGNFLLSADNKYHFQMSYNAKF